MVLNQQGLIISQAYEYVYGYTEDFAAVKRNGLVGFIDHIETKEFFIAENGEIKPLVATK